MKILAKFGSSLCSLAVAFAVLSLASVARATPYASCITNTAGTISFYLNESNANITVTYDDGSTNANFNGVSTGVGLNPGVKSFSLAGHTTYSISVTKTNPALGVILATGRSNARGVDVNKNPVSPYFGNVYSVNSSSTNIFRLNSDLSKIYSGAGGVAFGGSTLSPYRIYVASDDFLMVGDASSAHAGVWRLAPDLSTNQQILGPTGEANGLTAGSFGTVQSRPLLIGTLGSGNAVLMQVDGDISAPNGYNSLLIYNLGTNSLPWTNPPSVYGPEIGVGVNSENLGDNEYPGLTQGPNGYIYASTYRNNLSNPLIQIYDSTGTNPVWNSWIPAGTPYPGGAPTGDYFLQTVVGNLQALIDSAVSPDGKYLAGVTIDNTFFIVSLTNGIPDVTTIFSVPAPGTGASANARGIAFDAADNIYLSSSGLGIVESFSLGLSATAITTGNASGTTGFQLLLPSTQASLIPSVNTFASQGGSNGTPGTPTSSSFTVTRSSTNGYALPLLVNFTLTGTAPAGAYTISSPDGTISAGSNGVVIAANQTNATIVVTPTTNNVPRPPTTVILTLAAGGSYLVSAPFSDTNFIQNTSSQLLQIVSGGATSMYKAFSNDYGSFIVQRLGDTNASAYVVTNYTLTGTGVAGTDYTLPQALTVNPGDINITNRIFPLSGGLPPVDVINPSYTGNKSLTVALASGIPNYSNTTATASMTIIDNAEPPRPVLFANPLTDPNDATNWNITYGTGDEVNFPTNYNVDFGYDLTANNPNAGANGLIGLPPNGATNALRITCNKQANPGAEGAVNVYYTNAAFAGDYAVRFNMNLVQGADPTYLTEGVVFGINHGGTLSNWWYGSGPFTPGTWSSDGIWYYVTSDPGSAAAGDYIEFTGAGGTNGNTGWQQLAVQTWPTFANVYKTNVFTEVEGSNSGVPANGSPVNGANTGNWADVEIKQTHNIVTMSIDKTPIFTYTNTTVWTNGYLMLGYEDPFGGTAGISVGAPDAAAYFSNLRVVRLGPPVITGLALTNGNVVIQFSTTDGDDTAASFNLLSSGTSGARFVDGLVSTATFTQLGTNLNFQVVVSKPTNSAQYYRIQHK